VTQEVSWAPRTTKVRRAAVAEVTAWTWPGWRYDVSPKRDPYDNETGFVKFRIRIDADGNLIGVERLESTVSPHVEKWYRDQLQKTTFSRTGGGRSPTGATGTVTFVIRSRYYSLEIS
jgi:periplasmic protein TonB